MKEMLKLNKTKIQDLEQGRSMVEMLGVLAIIGVLSVAGIAGYTTAMNKHRANTLLNEASKRATVVAMQVTQGRETLSIEEFDDNISLGFSETVDHNDSNKTFTLTLSGVDEAVCQQMKSTVGDNGIMKISGTCGSSLTLTFNDDLSKDGSNSTENSVDVGSCTNGNVYLFYNVGAECDTTTPKDMECTKNSDCASAEKCVAGEGKCYCKLTGSDSFLVEEGTCETLDDGRETTYTNGNSSKTFLVGSAMNLWTAENWCKAHHMSLVSYSTLNSLFDCDEDDASSCAWNNLTTDSYWDNGALSSSAYWYWTARNDNSLAYILDLSMEIFDAQTPPSNYDDVDALCE